MFCSALQMVGENHVKKTWEKEVKRKKERKKISKWGNKWHEESDKNKAKKSHSDLRIVFCTN